MQKSFCLPLCQIQLLSTSLKESRREPINAQIPWVCLLDHYCVCVTVCMCVCVFEHEISDEKFAHVRYGEEEQAEYVLVLAHVSVI